MLSKKHDRYLTMARSRIHGSQEWRKAEGYDDLWLRMVDLYRGRHFEGLSDEDRIAVNICFSTINIIEPSIAVNHPNLTVMARLPEEEDRSVIVETVVNYWWRTYEITEEFRASVKDFLICGHGWLKSGWRFVEEETDKDDDAVVEEMADLIGQADDLAQMNPELAADLPTDDDIADNVILTDMLVVEDRPFAERVSPHDMFVDPDATSMTDLRWIAQRLVRDIDEVRKDPNYGPAKKRIKADRKADESRRSTRRGEEDVDSSRVTIWEYYDRQHGTMAVFAESGDDFLVEPRDMPYKFGHPFTMLRNYDIPDHFYPMGELEAIEDLQQELNKTRSQQMTDRRRYKRKYLADSRAFSAANIAALQSDNDGEIAFVNEGIELQAAILPMPQTPADPTSYQMSEQIQSDVNSITAVSEYARGGGDQAIRRTATEASIIQDAANARATDKLQAIEKYIGQVGRRIIMLAQQFMSEPAVARIVGKNGAPLWFEFEPEWLAGEYDFEVEGGSTQPKNETLRRQETAELMQAMGPFIESGLINVPELIRHVLQKGFGIKNPEKFMAPQQPMVDPETGQPLGAPPGTEEEEMIPADGPPMPQGPSEAPGPPADVRPQLEGQTGLSLMNS